MTFSLPFDVFFILLEKLTFNEVIPLRRVCSQWREWIDEYLRKQRTIEIYTKNWPEFELHPRLTGISLTMDLDINRIFSKRLILSRAKMCERSFPESITRMFPNITELFLHSGYSIPSHVAYTMHRRLFHYWRDLETLLFSPGEDKSCISLIKLLNELESLSVLMIEGNTAIWIGLYNPKRFFLKEPFLKRLKGLSVPSITWLGNLEDVLHINKFATLIRSEIIHDKLERLFVKNELWTESTSLNCVVFNFLDDLAKRCLKIRALEFSVPFAYNFHIEVCSLFICNQFTY